MAKKKNNIEELVTKFTADNKQYISAMDAMIKKVKELIAVEKELQKIIDKRK